MARQSFQMGYVSEGTRDRNGATKFVIRYRLRSAEGKWKHKSEVLHGLTSRKAARSVLQQRIQEATNQAPAAQELTVQGFIDSYWRPYVDRKGLKPSTRKSYECGLQTLVIPRLGSVRVLDVSPLHIEDLIRTRTSDGVSPKTILNDLVLLQSIFSLAVDNDLITRSPIRRRHKPVVTKLEKPTWTPEQVRSILESVPQSFRPLFVCAALTGVRLGELLGLKWRNLCFEQDCVEIRQALWHRQLVSPKTASSVRRIAMTPTLKSALRDRWNDSAHRSADDFVFCDSAGSPHCADVLRRDVLYPTLDRIGIPRSKRNAGFHTFRHSVASFINRETGNLKLAQKLLGHANINITSDVYTHTSAKEDREAALAVERAIYGDLFATVRDSANKNSSGAVN